MEIISILLKEYLEVHEDEKWKPWCRCNKEPLKIPPGGDMILCMTPVGVKRYLPTLERHGIVARVTKGVCPVFDEPEEV